MNIASENMELTNKGYWPDAPSLAYNARLGVAVVAKAVTTEAERAGLDAAQTRKLEAEVALQMVLDGNVRTAGHFMERFNLTINDLDPKQRNYISKLLRDQTDKVRAKFYGENIRK